MENLAEGKGIVTNLIGKLFKEIDRGETSVNAGVGFDDYRNKLSRMKAESKRRRLRMDNYDFIIQKTSELLSIVNELEKQFPGRKFSLDGHLFGSLGEVIAKYYYGIELYPNNTKTHDGEKDGKKVQIKITQGNSVDINDIPENLLVLFLHKQDGVVYEVYNGPCVWLNECKRTKNGWYNRSLSTLSEKDKKIPDEERLKANHNIEKWSPDIRN